MTTFRLALFTLFPTVGRQCVRQLGRLIALRVGSRAIRDARSNSTPVTWFNAAKVKHVVKAGTRTAASDTKGNHTERARTGLSVIAGKRGNLPSLEGSGPPSLRVEADCQKQGGNGRGQTKILKAGAGKGCQAPRARAALFLPSLPCTIFSTITVSPRFTPAGQHYRGPHDFEIHVRTHKLSCWQTRNGKRTVSGCGNRLPWTW